VTNFEPCAAEVMRRFAAASGGKWIEVGGGVAGFSGPDSPVNAAKGMDGAVGSRELEQVVGFYKDLGLDAVVELAPWVEAQCSSDLAALGFERLAEEYVMVRRSEALDEQLDVITDTAAWSRVLCLAFFGEVNEMGMRLGQVMQGADIGESLGIWQGEELAAAGQLSILAGAGLLAGDGTVEAWRGKGLQQRLIRGRVRRAWELGVGWVHSEVAPDSGSYRNYVRCGFSRAYSRVHYLKRV
jgi:GNAT superfamily N-acetyltransferase